MPKSKNSGLKRVCILEKNFNYQSYFQDITIFEMCFIKTWDYRNCKPKTLGQSNKKLANGLTTRDFVCNTKNIFNLFLSSRFIET